MGRKSTRETRLAKAPWEGCWVTEPEYFPRLGRYQIRLRTSEKKWVFIPYARYIMSVHMGSELASSMQVDHVDGDKTHDRLENLQILSASENSKKRKFDYMMLSKKIEIKCPGCGKLVHKDPKNTHLTKKGRTFSTCSSKCNGIITAIKRYGSEEQKAELETKIAGHVVRVIEGSSVAPPATHNIEDWKNWTTEKI